MRGLVTVFGGSGFIGSQTVRALAKQGWRIRVAVRRPWKAYRQRLLGDVGQIEIVQANVRVAATVERALDGAEAVVYAVGAAFESGAQKFQVVHADGPRAAAEAAAGLGIDQFVFVSGIGADAGSPSKAARAKAEGEAAVRAAIPAAVILRPSVVFGPEDAFFNKLASMAVMSPVMPVFGAEVRVQPVFVADVARAAAAALSDPAAAGRTFELGGPSIYTLKELTELTLAEIGRPRAVLPLSWSAAGLLSVGGDMLAFLRGPLPMLPVPPITSDQLALLRTDNVVADDAPGLAALGIAAAALEPIIPTYLYRYRKGGQYADLAPPEPLKA
ncbi:MAG TPA: complex I NDUFA9 subunit family protein [Caulobacteraceae bacterium]|jgi:NADH dehydrogenase|nr:complex I NDUFA9 subunit family protein [Caulobacteraceae bacterium]